MRGHWFPASQDPLVCCPNLHHHSFLTPADGRSRRRADTRIAAVDVAVGGIPAGFVAPRVKLCAVLNRGQGFNVPSFSQLWRCPRAAPEFRPGEGGGANLAWLFQG